MGSLERVFPILRQVPSAPGQLRRGPEATDPHDLRRRAVGALRELLARLGDRRPLVVTIDDLQWGDADSVALIFDLLRPPDPPVLLLIGAYRSEDMASSAVLQALVEEGSRGALSEQRVVEVGELLPSEAEELAWQLLGRGEGSQAVAAAIARESEGNPFFVAELVRHVQSGSELGSGALMGSSVGTGLVLEQVLWERIVRLPPPARLLLEVIAVAGRPLGQAEAERASKPGVDVRVASGVLRAGRLVRVTGSGEWDKVETYHDRIRETVLGHLGREELARHHRRLGEVLEATGRADAEELAVHFLGAGEDAKAGRYYAAAGSQAAAALAFDQAATLYRLALELNPDEGLGGDRVRVQLAAALANSGRGAEAAREYLALADAASGREAMDLRLCAAKQLLGSGNIDDGLKVLDQLLRTVGMRLPTTWWWAISSLLLSRLRVRLCGYRYRERQAGSIPQDLATKIDLCWTIATGMGLVDYVRGGDFHCRHLLLAFRAGEPRVIARSLAWEGARTGALGTSRRTRAEKIFQAVDTLVDRLDDPYCNGMRALTRGAAAYLQLRWGEALSFLDRAESIFHERCTGVSWELDTTHTFALWSLIYLGNLAELGRRFSPLLLEARDRSDLYLLMNLSTFIMAVVHAKDDDPKSAREELMRITRRWSQAGFHVQHHNVLLARAVLDLYEDEGNAAWDYMSSQERAYRRSALIHVQHTRVDLLQWQARSALAVAAQARNPVPFLRAAGRNARRLRRERAPCPLAHAHLLQAGIARVRGNLEAAATHLQTAAATYEAAEMHLYAATVRRRIGELTGGDEGRMLKRDANAWMESQGIANPGRITAMYTPGFPEPT
jgi:tetratricopeptide (TPR) repeat protein